MPAHSRLRKLSFITTATHLLQIADTTLRFTDIGLGNTDADVVIDTVSVVPTTIPAPTFCRSQTGISSSAHII